MKLEQQVVSLELAKRLKELGVKQESYWFWAKHKIIRPVAHLQDMYAVTLPEVDYYSAYTVAELGEMLPEFINENGKEKRLSQYRAPFLDDVPPKTNWDIFYQFTNSDLRSVCEKYPNHQSARTEADTRSKMLIYLLEKKLLKL